MQTGWGARQKVCRKSFTRSYILKERIKNDLPSTLVYRENKLPSKQRKKTKIEERKVKIVL